jgi:hypothetical protein
MTISVDWHDDDDNSFTIHWDENDPFESVFNDWTEQDFLDYFTRYARDIINELGPDSSEEWSEEDWGNEEDVTL